MSSSKNHQEQEVLREDSDDEDDDDIHMVEPPLKKNRYAERDEVNIIRSGSVKPCRLSDAKRYYFQSRFNQSSSGSNIMKTYERNIPIKFHSSKASTCNKENALESQLLSEPDVEFLGISPKESTPYSSKVSRKSNGNEGTIFQSPIFSSFKFKPSLTSTIGRSTDLGLGATGRKPIKSSESLKPKSSLHELATNSGIRKRYSNITGDSKKKPVFSSIKSCGIKKFITGVESYRLDDKERYRQLLQQYTSSDLTPFSSSKKMILPTPACKAPSTPDIASRAGAIIKSHLDPVATTKSRLRLEKNEDFPIPSLALPSIPTFNSTKKNDIKTLSLDSVPVIDLESETNEEKNDDTGDDIIFMEEITTQKPRKNSLEDKLQKSVFYCDDWLKDMKQYYNDKKKETDSEIQMTYDAKKRCEESRLLCKENLMDKVARRISQLDIKYPKRVVEITEEEEEELPELTSEMENIINRAFKGGPPGQVLAEKFNIQITRRDIHTLAGLNWLNDEVINFYMNLLMERGKNDNYPSVYAFNTFFYSKLVKTGYASIKRWTKKVDIFSYDILLIPVHLGMHWCLSAIDFRSKNISYYDSMLGDNNKCLMELKKYLDSEHLDKKKSLYGVTDLSLENVKEIPQQMNGSDCGMFSCKFAEYLSRDARISFTQEHMPYFRRRMVYEIVSQKLM